MIDLPEVLLVLDVVVFLLEAIETPGDRYMGNCAKANRLVDSVGRHMHRTDKTVLTKKNQEVETLSRNCCR